MQKSVKKRIVDLIILIFASCCCALGTVGIMIPNGLSSGGISGIIRIMQYFWPNLSYGITYYAFCVILLGVVLWTLGKEEAKRMVLMTILAPTLTLVFERLDFAVLEETDLVLAAIYYGVLYGIGGGLIFDRGYANTGADTIAKILRRKVFKTASLARILLVFNGTIVLLSGIFYGRNIALYTLISEYLSSKTIEMVMYGLRSHVVKVEIITGQVSTVQSYVLNDIKRGVSVLDVTGAYTGTLRKQLLIYCSPREAVLIKKFVAQTDPNAFISIIKVDNVWGIGSGFSELQAEEK